MLTTAVTGTSTKTWFWITKAHNRIKLSMPQVIRNLSLYELRKKFSSIQCLMIKLHQKLARYVDILKVFLKIRPVEEMSYS